MTFLSLRNRIFISLLGIAAPLALFTLMSQSSLLGFIRGTPGFTGYTQPLMSELLRIESKVERLASAMLEPEYQGEIQGLRAVNELRTSASILENLLANRSSIPLQINQIQRCIEHLDTIIRKCGKSCLDERKAIEREQRSIDDSSEELLHAEIARIGEAYQTLRERVNAENARAIWALFSLFGILAVASYWLSAKISSELEVLDSATQALARGDMNFPLPIPSRDEIGRLIDSFELMRRNLEQSTVTRRYLEILLDTLGEGVVVTGATGELEVMNPAAADLLANLPDGYFENAISIIPISESHSATLTPFQVKSPQGKDRYLVVTKAQINESDSSTRGFVYGIKEVTEKIELENELAAHRERLSKGERIMALGTLGAIVAHKLSQPISSTKLFLQQAARGAAKAPETHDVQECIQAALEEVTRIAGSISQMMSLRKAETTASSYRCEVNVGETIERVLSSMASTINRYHARAVSAIPQNLDMVRCRESEFEEVIYCLIMNALQAGVPTRETIITLKATFNLDKAYIEISDNCSGIPEENLDSIFDYFFTTKDSDQGTGLGLAIVRHVIESHGGEITVRSMPGIGSTFLIELPVIGGTDAESTTRICG